MSFISVAQTTDPTKPLLKQASGLQTGVNVFPVLQSIVHSGEQLNVVINGKLLKQGDTFNQYHLQKVTSQYVILSSDEKKIKLSLFSSVVDNSKKKDK